ncbi:MAG: hypothetical protein D6820_07920 [Lentisphaerae bacterium]|nr:MAG: hypothetical protein D6820_07920 [Lentisphaerota bacterium]
MAYVSNKFAGLDTGLSTTSLVVLGRPRRRNAPPPVLGTYLFDHRKEGLVDEQEVIEHLPAWLRECQASGLETCIALPQYLSITQVSEFPAVKGPQLEQMIAYETQQLAGLTDEVFLHDHMQLKPFGGHANPVLLAVCRESVIDARLDALEPSQIPIAGIHMAGHMLAEAYLRFQPEEDREKMILLLDIGSENSTMVLVYQGQIIHLGSFLFGGDFFTEALAAKQHVNEAEAERIKKVTQLDVDDPQDPLREKAQSFLMELEAALDCCAFLNPADPETRIAKIYLSGGGSLLKGFDRFIHKTYACPVEYLRIPPLIEACGWDPEKGANPDQIDPVMLNIAYGLACQQACAVPAEQTISLTPERIQKQSLRRRRMIFPPIATTIVAISCICFIGLRYWLMEATHAQLVRTQRKLQQCQKIADPLEFNIEKIKEYRQMLLPFAAYGNRNQRIVDVVKALSQVRMQEDWFYYLSDPYSYFDKTEPVETFTATKANVQGVLPFTNLDLPEHERKERVINVIASSVHPLEGMVVCGFTPQRHSDRLRNVKIMQEKLRKLPLFRKVDTMPELSENDSLARDPWMKFGMRPFRLACIFQELEFNTSNIKKQLELKRK